MIYIFESKLSENKSVFLTLKYIYGIGKSNSFLICKKLGFSKNLKIKNITKVQINQLINTIENLKIKIGSDLKKLKVLNTKKLISIKSYKGIRKIRGLPIRGQRTHTNAKTSKKKL
jgi:small subunit ribosomal protein S13